MGLKLEMHDQCHRLNELILTFIANFLNGQSSVREKKRFLETCFCIL